MDTRTPTHIFIVENDNIFVRMLDYIFSKNLDYRFLDFKAGEDCLKNLHLNPDLVVIDYSLPAMNGFETLQELKELNPDVAVIMLISVNDGRLPAELLNAGARDYILKDGNEVNMLTEKIERFLQERQEMVKPKNKFPVIKNKLYYAIIILLLLTLGFYYYI
jgi:DNA-binding NarL/FixJ family response regulator